MEATLDIVRGKGADVDEEGKSERIRGRVPATGAAERGADKHDELKQREANLLLATLPPECCPRLVNVVSLSLSNIYHPV